MIPYIPTGSPENLEDDPIGIIVAQKTYRKQCEGTW